MFGVPHSRRLQHDTETEICQSLWMSQWQHPEMAQTITCIDIESTRVNTISLLAYETAYSYFRGKRCLMSTSVINKFV